MKKIQNAEKDALASYSIEMVCLHIQQHMQQSTKHSQADDSVFNVLTDSSFMRSVSKYILYEKYSFIPYTGAL